MMRADVRKCVLCPRSLLHSHMAEPRRATGSEGPLNGEAAKPGAHAPHRSGAHAGSALRPLRSAILELLKVRRKAELHADSQAHHL
jgi:hypothetical protein